MAPSISDLHGDGGGGELLLHGGEGAEVAVDGLGEGAGGLAGAARGQVLPEDGVVEVAAAVELQGALQPDDGGGVS